MSGLFTVEKLCTCHEGQIPINYILLTVVLVGIIGII